MYGRWVQPYLTANEPRIEALLSQWRTRMQSLLGPQALQSLQTALTRLFAAGQGGSSSGVSVVDFENVSARGDSPKKK